MCDLWPGDRGFCSLLFYCLMGLPKSSVCCWYIFEAGRMTVCLTSGQMIEVCVLFFFIVLCGWPKHLFGGWYIFEAGRMTVCVCDLWPDD